MAWSCCLVACDQLFSTKAPIIDASTIDAGPDVDAETPADADTSGCLRDTFHDADIDREKWLVADFNNMPVIITEQDHHLVIDLAAPMDGMYVANVLIGGTPRDVSNGSVTVEVVQHITSNGE